MLLHHTCPNTHQPTLDPTPLHSPILLHAPMLDCGNTAAPLHKSCCIIHPCMIVRSPSPPPPPQFYAPMLMATSSGVTSKPRYGTVILRPLLPWIVCCCCGWPGCCFACSACSCISSHCSGVSCGLWWTSSGTPSPLGRDPGGLGTRVLSVSAPCLLRCRDVCIANGCLGCLLAS